MIQDYISMGYAVPAYDLDSNHRYWRISTDSPLIKLPIDAVPLYEFEGMWVAKIEDVKNAR